MAAESIAIIQICNQALTQVGEPTITSLAEESKPARLCDLRFNDVKWAVLRAHPWNCATKRTSLARLTETPAYEFAYKFQLPADWLRLVSTQNPDISYRIEGRELLANEQTFNCKYVHRVDDVTDLDTLCQAAIAARLAAELALPLARSAERQKNLWEQYKEKLSEARFIDASEHPREGFRTNEWLDSRLGLDNDPYRRISSGS